jgi:peptidyl-prolyl cis-trans isomerase C
MKFSDAASRLAVATLLALPAFAVQAKTLATVDGQAITDQDVDDALADIGPNLPEKADPAARRKYVLDYLIDLKLVSKKAEADKIDADPEFQRKAAYFRDKLAMEAELSKIGKEADTDKAEHAAYDDAAKAQPPEVEIHARHILLPDEASAKAALERIKKGEDFAKVATEVSKDPGSEGGDLGWFTKDRMVPEFSEQAFKMEPGQVSEPVKSQFGWHIIKVEEKRMKTFPPFDQVKEQASKYVQQKAQSEVVTDLRKTAKIERFDTDAAAPAAPATPAAPAAPATPSDNTTPPK